MKLIFREGSADDAKAMAAIEQDCFSDPWSEESFGQMMSLSAARSITVWAENEGEQLLAGYLLAFALPPEAEIANIAVAPAFQRRGVGRALMDEGLRSLREEGCDSFFLEVRESNLAAQALYRRLGFVEIGRRKRYYQKPTEDALLMALLPQEA